MAKKKTNKISYGNVELDKDEFDPKYTKVRITTFVDLDILKKLKKTAKKLNVGYQTLLNQKLREVILLEKNPRQTTIEEILTRLEDLEKKVS